MKTKLTCLFKTSIPMLVTAVCLCCGCAKLSETSFVLRPSSDESRGTSDEGRIPASQDEKMQWFREAKFGLFIHWGLYAIPAGEWKGQPVAGIGEWVMNRARIPVKEYEQLASQFNPVKFNAEEWVQLADDAGMKYIVITSKHHDGFAMYGSRASKYNIVDATPFERDPLKELAEACARHGIRFGFYYSQAQDWHEPNAAGNTWDFGPDDKKNFDQYLRDKAEPQVRELLTGYGPVCLIWFDTPRMMTKERGQRFVDIVHTLQPACLIDGRLGIEGDYRSMGDNRIPNTVVASDWEVPATLNRTWGYKKDDNDWKTPGDITFKLVDIVSKGGNYLLNVGPTAEGVIPQPSQDNLRAIGRWLKVNGKAIYGAGPTPFGGELGTYDPDPNKKDSRGNPVFIAKTDWRCTTRPGKLYFTIFKMPREGFELPAFKTPIKKAYFLGDPKQENIPVETVNGVRIVKTPRNGPDAMANVLCVEIDGNQVEIDSNQVEPKQSAISSPRPPADANSVISPPQLSAKAEAGGQSAIGAPRPHPDANLATFAKAKPAEIRTPKPPGTPRINGPSVLGVRPDSPFLYRIPATGDRPMEFSVDGLPAGLQVDSRTGQIAGSLDKPGEHIVTLRAKNALGASEKKFKIVVGETIALTPPMGWNSWNCWGSRVDAEKVLQSARAMASSGLINHGWTYINIDDAWQGKRGGPFNAIQGNEKFPDMKGLCDQIHNMGLKVGIYSTPWTTSYATYIGGSAENPDGNWAPPTISKRGNVNKKILPWAIGKYSFARNDARQWAAWGIDYLKYDWNPNELPETKEMYDALRASGRDVILSLSNSTPFQNIGDLCKLANCWRITGDIRDNWKSMSSKGFGQDKWVPYQSPGHWNDPDMLVVGYVGWGKPHPTGLTPDEQYTHISIWCLVSAPLLLGCDMEKLDEFTLNLLTNDEVLAVNQDPLGKQATCVSTEGELQVYARDLEDGSKAVGLFNLGDKEATVTAKWSDLKLADKMNVRDLWRQKDLGQFDGQFQVTVAPHGAELVKIQPGVIR